jgi:antitoxin (DNA-binding transcriptional repressor) of toxin-antitoxin stability system
MKIKINMISRMKTISMAELRNHSMRIVRELKRGERMMLSYRGKPLAELSPATAAKNQLTPLEALTRAQTLTAQDPGYVKTAKSYLRELRQDQQSWSERAPA